jgi:hypothetical protein
MITIKPERFRGSGCRKAAAVWNELDFVGLTTSQTGGALPSFKVAVLSVPCLDKWICEP